MSVKVSKRVEHAIKATSYLAKHYSPDTYVRATEIAKAERLPSKFLETILPNLKEANVVTSRVGIGGGYRLAKPPEKTYVRDIVGEVERWPKKRGAKTAGDQAFERVVGTIQAGVSKGIGNMTLAQLAGVRGGASGGSSRGGGRKSGSRRGARGRRRR